MTIMKDKKNLQRVIVLKLLISCQFQKKNKKKNTSSGSEKNKNKNTTIGVQKQ